VETGTERIIPYLVEGAAPRSVGSDIWSMLPPSSPEQPYDRKAAVYDALIGSSWYNRFIWGADHRSYAAFARQALGSAAGRHLDAGCGSLVGTANAYVEPAQSRSARPCLFVDASLGMLRRARARLGGLPSAAGFLQADLRTIPLRFEAIDSVLCMGMLHLFDHETAAGILARIRECLVPRGALYLTSLVLGRPRGDRFLGLLQRAGEIGVPRTRDGALAIMRQAGFDIGEVRQAGNMLYVVAARR
jgi:SAM-dependent methyltransferase